jgi:hypothetical protein
MRLVYSASTHGSSSISKKQPSFMANGVREPMVLLAAPPLHEVVFGQGVALPGFTWFALRCVPLSAGFCGLTSQHEGGWVFVGNQQIGFKYTWMSPLFFRLLLAPDAPCYCSSLWHHFLGRTLTTCHPQRCCSNIWLLLLWQAPSSHRT